MRRKSLIRSILDHVKYHIHRSVGLSVLIFFMCLAIVIVGVCGYDLNPGFSLEHCPNSTWVSADGMICIDVIRSNPYHNYLSGELDIAGETVCFQAKKEWLKGWPGRRERLRFFVEVDGSQKGEIEVPLIADSDYHNQSYEGELFAAYVWHIKGNLFHEEKFILYVVNEEQSVVQQRRIVLRKQSSEGQ